jgi:hypothetical protein
MSLYLPCWEAGETLFSLPQHIIRAIAQRGLLSDDDLMIGSQQVNFLVTLNYVLTDDLQWVIMTLVLNACAMVRKLSTRRR